VDVEFQLDDGSPCTYVGTVNVYRCRAVVTVTYVYEAATPLIGNLLGQIDLVGESTFPVSSDCLEPVRPQCPLGT
jgi:hypothetical protein